MPSAKKKSPPARPRPMAAGHVVGFPAKRQSAAHSGPPFRTAGEFLASKPISEIARLATRSYTKLCEFNGDDRAYRRRKAISEKHRRALAIAQAKTAEDFRLKAEALLLISGSLEGVDDYLANDLTDRFVGLDTCFLSLFRDLMKLPKCAAEQLATSEAVS